MRCDTWLQRMDLRIAKWKSSQNVSVHHYEVRPPVSARRLRDLSNKLWCKIPSDLMEFYLTGSGMCNVEFAFDVPVELAFRRGRNTTYTISGGLQVQSPDQLVKLRRYSSGIMESYADSNVRKFEPFIQSGIPLWIGGDSDILIYLTENAIL